MNTFEVNGFPLPRLLIELMQQGNWRHPGDDVIPQVIPFLDKPLDFLLSVEAMRFNSSGFLADDPEMSRIFHEVRGLKQAPPVDLPWLDTDKAVFLAVNRFPGDDIGIALDYRTGEPRVVASEWSPAGCMWREISPNFSRFTEQLGLVTSHLPSSIDDI